MNEDDTKVAAVAKKIRSVHQEYNSGIYKELYSMAPSALPERQPIEIRIGLEYYAGPESGDISYVNYLRGAVLSYLQYFADGEINAPEARSILESMDGFPWKKDMKGSGTFLQDRDNHVYIGWLPANVRHEADRELGRFIDQEIRDRRFKTMVSVGDKDRGFNAQLSCICDEKKRGSKIQIACFA